MSDEPKSSSEWPMVIALLIVCITIMVLCGFCTSSAVQS